MAEPIERTPFQAARDHAEQTGTWPERWGPFHRHYASDAIHRDGGPECDQPGTPRRVYMYDDDTLADHERAVGRWAIRHPAQFTEPTDPVGAFQVVAPDSFRSRLEKWLTSSGLYLFEIRTDGDLPTYGIGMD